MQKTGIEWTDYSSALLKYRDADGKVVWHCEKTSPGCAHCYSEAIAERFDRGGPFLPMVTPGVTPFFDEAEARRILNSKKLAGRRVFVNDMTDWMGPWVPDEIADRHFALFAMRPDVTFQTLTKRAGRQRRYMATAGDSPTQDRWEQAAVQIAESPCAAGIIEDSNFPPLNWHCGVSVEDQARADERIPPLLQTPAAVRFLSVEPLLSELNLRPYFAHSIHCEKAHPGGGPCACPRLHWVIIGGESGHNARPCDLAWVRSLVAQCWAASVPAFAKQLGARPTIAGYPVDGNLPWEEQYYADGRWSREPRPPCFMQRVVRLRDPKGGDMREWPEDLRVRDFPEARP